MTSEVEQKDPLVVKLNKLVENRDRGALAALRRSLGQPTGFSVEAGRILQPLLGIDAPQYKEDAYYLIGGLFALHPSDSPSGDMGSHLAGIRGKDDTAVERRFIALLNAHPDDLPDALRQAVSLLKAKDTPVNWQALLRDVLSWGHPSGFVQKKWARSFWRSAPQSVLPDGDEGRSEELEKEIEPDGDEAEQDQE